MSKPNKEQIQKIVMGGLLVVIVFYGFFVFLLGPAQKSIVLLGKENEELTTKISAADKKIQQVKALESKVTEAGETLDLIAEYMPGGAPIAWFPPRIKRFFERHGFKDVVVRMTGESGFRQDELKEYRQLSWTVQLPRAGFVPCGIAIAALENEEPFLEITQLEINGSLENPEFQRVSFVAHTVLKK